jgi:hypothetical protein
MSYTKIIGEAKKARFEAAQIFNEKDQINFTIPGEKKAASMTVKSFRDISNAPSGTIITINTYSYMKTNKGMWVYHDGTFLTEFDFFISILRAVDSHMEISLAYYPGRH